MSTDAGKDWGQEDKGVDRGWDGWMASLIQWTWVWVKDKEVWHAAVMGSQSRTRPSGWHTHSVLLSNLISQFIPPSPFLTLLWRGSVCLFVLFVWISISTLELCSSVLFFYFSSCIHSFLCFILFFLNLQTISPSAQSLWNKFISYMEHLSYQNRIQKAVHPRQKQDLHHYTG